MRISLNPLFTGLVLLVLNHQLYAQVSFSPPVSYNVGSLPFSVVAADVNGDGKPDLIIANKGTNTLSVLTNDGNGGFVITSTLTTGTNPISIVAVDVNGDRTLDLISANSGDNTLSILTNDGTGGFALASTPIVRNHPLSVAAADVNGDGKIDLISANGQDNTLSVLTNNGSGGFVTAGTYIVGTNPVCVIAADVNGDGKMDLVCANNNEFNQSQTLTVMTNDGTGGFAIMSSPVVSSFGLGAWIMASDVNGDGKMDLIINAMSPPSAITVLTNDGSGGFTLDPLSLFFGPLTISFSAAAADINGDGKVDLIASSYEFSLLFVATNNGNGNFTRAASLNTGGAVTSVTSADVNGDGRLDLIALNLGGSVGTIVVFTNTAAYLPKLTIKNSASKTVVSWPSQWTDWAGWTLQQNTNLDPTTWTSFTGIIGGDETTKTVTNSSPAGNLFFRLAHP